jgi:endonuclease YncB( thermonuclease family)
VIGLSDGDTITVLDQENVQHKVRLEGIDAPESRQAFGTVSRRNLADLAFNHEVTVQYSKTDQYGRLVGKVIVDGRDVNLEQIEAGQAWHYKEYQNEQSPEDRTLYAEAETKAREEKRGLWTDPLPTPPWEYRHAKDRNVTPNATSLSDSTAVETASGQIIGNKRSKIYHWPGCTNYDDIAPHNRVSFASRDEAERAGYRAARNCP